jgi:hypothetical protein
MPGLRTVVELGLYRKDEMVYRFKGFDSAECGDSMSALEAMVNAWMEGERPRIRQFCQSMRGEHILLGFVYEDTRELEQRASSHKQAGITGSLPRFYEEDYLDERPTNPRIPATPPPVINANIIHDECIRIERISRKSNGSPIPDL